MSTPKGVTEIEKLNKQLGVEKEREKALKEEIELKGKAYKTSVAFQKNAEIEKNEKQIQDLKKQVQTSLSQLSAAAKPAKSAEAEVDPGAARSGLLGQIRGGAVLKKTEKPIESAKPVTPPKKAPAAGGGGANVAAQAAALLAKRKKDAAASKSPAPKSPYQSTSGWDEEEEEAAPTIAQIRQQKEEEAAAEKAAKELEDKEKIAKLQQDIADIQDNITEQKTILKELNTKVSSPDVVTAYDKRIEKQKVLMNQLDSRLQEVEGLITAKNVAAKLNEDAQALRTDAEALKTAPVTVISVAAQGVPEAPAAPGAPEAPPIAPAAPGAPEAPPAPGAPDAPPLAPAAPGAPDAPGAPPMAPAAPGAPEAPSAPAAPAAPSFAGQQGGGYYAATKGKAGKKSPEPPPEPEPSAGAAAPGTSAKPGVGLAEEAARARAAKQGGGKKLEHDDSIIELLIEGEPEETSEIYNKIIEGLGEKGKHLEDLIKAEVTQMKKEKAKSAPVGGGQGLKSDFAAKMTARRGDIHEGGEPTEIERTFAVKALYGKLDNKIKEGLNSIFKQDFDRRAAEKAAAEKAAAQAKREADAEAARKAAEARAKILASIQSDVKPDASKIQSEQRDAVRKLDDDISKFLNETAGALKTEASKVTEALSSAESNRRAAEKEKDNAETAKAAREVAAKEAASKAAEVTAAAPAADTPATPTTTESEAPAVPPAPPMTEAAPSVATVTQEAPTVAASTPSAAAPGVEVEEPPPPPPPEEETTRRQSAAAATERRASAAPATPAAPVTPTKVSKGPSIYASSAYKQSHTRSVYDTSKTHAADITKIAPVETTYGNPDLSGAQLEETPHPSTLSAPRGSVTQPAAPAAEKPATAAPAAKDAPVVFSRESQSFNRQPSISSSSQKKPRELIKLTEVGDANQTLLISASNAFKAYADSIPKKAFASFYKVEREIADKIAKELNDHLANLKQLPDSQDNTLYMKDIKRIIEDNKKEYQGKVNVSHSQLNDIFDTVEKTINAQLKPPPSAKP